MEKEIRLDFTINATVENMPDGENLADALNEALPREWFDWYDEFQLLAIRFENFDDDSSSLLAQIDELRDLLARKDEEIKRLQIIRDNIAGVNRNLTEKNNNQVVTIEELQARLKQPTSVGITTDEYEQVREAARKAIDRAGQARIEDASGAFDNLFDEIDDALDLLPTMDERDLGWGDDEQFTELEAVSATISDQATELAAMLNMIRRGQYGQYAHR